MIEYINGMESEINTEYSTPCVPVIHSTYKYRANFLLAVHPLEKSTSEPYVNQFLHMKNESLIQT